MRPPLVLAYHVVGNVPREHDPDNLLVSPEQFRFQVGRLRKRGYEFVKLGEFARHLHSRASLEGVCALTFDDGSVDNATILPGLLSSLGVPATLFVCPDLLGRAHPWLAPESNVRLMNANELLTISRLGSIEIGSHTNAHTDLSSATAEEAYNEMTSSKRAVEDLVGRPIETFAYPYCYYSPVCPAAAERAGYICAVTCGPRGSWNPYELKRQMMDGSDGRLAFALKSRGLFHTVLESPPWRLVRRARGALRRPPHGS